MVEGKTVWIVDDEQRVVSTMSKLLATRGYEVMGFGQAKSALDYAAEREPPAVLVTDYQMPGMTGAELVDALDVRGCGGFPVVCTTGYLGAVPRDVRSRFAVVLEKPFRFAKLLAAIEGVLVE